MGSTNPAKVNAVKGAFEQIFPGEELKMCPCSAASGVSDQPMGDEETRQGATTRAQNAAKHFADANDGCTPDYAVGLEGGCGDAACHTGYAGSLECFAWMVVIAQHGTQQERISSARTASFVLPRPITDLMHKEGLELGDADDRIFAQTNTKQKVRVYALHSSCAVCS